jgi:hypothetical protein
VYISSCWDEEEEREGVNSGKNGGVGLDWGDLNVQPLNASLATSALLMERESGNDAKHLTRARSPYMRPVKV